MKKVLLSIIILITAAFVYYIAANYSPYETGDAEGEITILVIDKSGETVINDTFLFYEEDTLFSILDNAYAVEYQSMDLTLWNQQTLKFNTVSSRVILSIENVTTNFETNYLKILLERPIESNGVITYKKETAKIGIDGIPLYDDATYIFKYEQVRNGGGD